MPATPATVVRQALWHAEVAQSGHDDKIVVQDLYATVNAGTDVWGRRKIQRALITVTLTLHRQFTTAASTDIVDSSTVHYGTLTKAIRERIEDEAMAWMSTPALASLIMNCVQLAAASTELYAVQAEIFYVKGSMFGDGAGYTASSIAARGLWSHVLYLRNVRIPCIIGVNPNERQQKQTVVVNIWIDGVPKERHDDYSALETFLFAVSIGACVYVLLLTSASAYPSLLFRPLKACSPGSLRSSSRNSSSEKRTTTHGLDSALRSLRQCRLPKRLPLRLRVPCDRLNYIRHCIIPSRWQWTRCNC